MIHRQPAPRPKYVYPAEEWRIVEKQFYPRFLEGTETIFSTSNGYLGLRGNFEEGRPVSRSTTLVNGFYESWPIVHGEEAFGFAKTGQTIVNVTDTKIIKLYVDDEPFFLPTATLLRFERALDMQAGTLDREILWETPAGKRVAIKSRRLVSFQHRHLAAIAYEVTVLNAAAPIVISSEMEAVAPGLALEDPEVTDPRQTRQFRGRVLTPQGSEGQDRRILLSHQTASSNMRLTCGIDHTIETECAFSCDAKWCDDNGKVVISAEAQPGLPIRLVKYMAYHTSRSAGPQELTERTHRTLDRATRSGFDDLLASQRQYLDDFWRRSDVEMKGDPYAQQAIRFNIFQICQATGRAEGVGLPAKGLTGDGYEGHYFWDTEIYVLPFLIYTSPRIAKNLLSFRHSYLDKARQRAREVNQKGALFPWRTINGDEASAYYAAGTAQYHINADIVYGIRKYVDVSGDEEFLWGAGAEILVETARLWEDLGFFSERKGGKFCIDGVTGPDEYNTVVNNNTFTNLMARENLWYAASTVESLQRNRPERFAALVHETGLDPSEIAAWKRAADNMYVPYAEEPGIHPQDDAFLSRESWDFDNVPAEKYPLLLHFHPLVIYRHRVIKQADIVLAMFLLSSEFSFEQKQRNFEYYDPLTTGDSSLSCAIQAILASEIGAFDLARQYADYALYMDLGDVHGNVKDGVHLATLGGTWMCVVYGIAGLRDDDGQLCFRPRLTERFQEIRFKLTVRGQMLEVHIQREKVTYLLCEGSELVIQHNNKEIELKVGVPATLPVFRVLTESGEPVGSEARSQSTTRAR
jgi:alpha,alpha-trehalose phosphorylase